MAGTYLIVASTDKANISSRYSLSVHTVPADQNFSVRLPLSVSPDAPQRGAGRITAQGAQQFYDFTAKPGTVVHIESKCSCSNLSIRAVSAGDTTRFGYLDLTNINDDWKLPEGGKYTIQVRSNGYTGAYTFTATQGERQRH